MKLRSITILVFVFSILLISCGGPTTVQISETPLATQTPVKTLTSTLQADLTERSIPTLTSGEQLLQIKEWLATNAGCRLPCWWGIEPGKITWGEVSEFLRRIGTKSSDYEESGVVIHEAVGFDFDPEHVFTRVGFAETDASITAIIIRAFGLNDSPNFKSIWSSFSPEKIIAGYGAPSRVWVRSKSSVHEGSPGPTMAYSIWFFYDHLGILVRYSGQVGYESIYKMCPVFGEQGNLSDDIDIFLQSPDTNTPLENLPTVKYNANGAISLEEAAGISLNEFYNLFTIAGVEPCFETPRNIWP